MNVVSEHFDSPTGGTVAGHRRETYSTPMRIAAILFGFAFIWAGAGLWLVPGLDLNPSVLLAKMFLSIMMVTAGVGMTQIGTWRANMELHFDSRHRQLRVVEIRARGRAHTIKTINFETIARVDVSDDALDIYDDAGRVLVSLPLDGPDARLDAIAQLRGHPIMLA